MEISAPSVIPGKEDQITLISEFVEILDDYIHWYNEKRIKQSPGGLSPLDYRRKMVLTA